MTTQSTLFDKASEYYDLIYRDKGYEEECDFLERAFRKHSLSPVRSIVEGGCGTGGHAIPLARRGYKVVGVDVSEGMVGRAREKSRAAGLDIDFLVQDLRSLRLESDFDAAIAMFAVIDYFATNSDLRLALQSMRRALRDHGLFVFDFWNGVAVLRSLPETRLKVIDRDGLKVIRTIEPELDTLHHVCRRKHHVLVRRGDAIIDEFEETHVVRFLFPQELAHYLDDAGFDLLELCPFLRLGEDLDDREWNATAIARAR